MEDSHIHARTLNVLIHVTIHHTEHLIIVVTSTVKVVIFKWQNISIFPENRGVNHIVIYNTCMYFIWFTPLNIENFPNFQF